MHHLAPARACKLAGIGKYTIHDHRQTAAVALARAGMPLNLIQRQLGHTNIAITMKYATFPLRVEPALRVPS